MTTPPWCREKVMVYYLFYIEILFYNFMLIRIDNISHCYEILITDVSTIPMTTSIKVTTVRK